MNKQQLIINYIYIYIWIWKISDNNLRRLLCHVLSATWNPGISWKRLKSPRCSSSSSGKSRLDRCLWHRGTISCATDCCFDGLHVHLTKINALIMQPKTLQTKQHLNGFTSYDSNWFNYLFNSQGHNTIVEVSIIDMIALKAKNIASPGCPEHWSKVVACWCRQLDPAKNATGGCSNPHFVWPKENKHGSTDWSEHWTLVKTLVNILKRCNWCHGQPWPSRPAQHLMEWKRIR